MIHGFGRFFPWKQLLLLAGKAAAYICSDSGASQNQLALMAVMTLNVLFLPLMYLFALPLDDDMGDRVFAARDVVDVDIAVRVARAVANERSRRESVLECKRRARMTAIGAAQLCPAAGEVFCRVDPQLQRVILKSGRSV